MACGRGEMDVVYTLLAAGADPMWAYGRVGRRPLHDAVDTSATLDVAKALVFALVRRDFQPASIARDCSA